MSDPVDLEHVRILRLQPGDTVVLQLDYRAPTHVIHHAKDLLRATFPDNECLVLCEASLSVARAAEREPGTVEE